MLDYLLRDLRHPGGGFYAAEDADSLDPAVSRAAVVLCWRAGQRVAPRAPGLQPGAPGARLLCAPPQDGTKKEGAFYVWSEGEIRSVLGERARGGACPPPQQDKLQQQQEQQSRGLPAPLRLAAHPAPHTPPGDERASIFNAHYMVKPEGNCTLSPRRCERCGARATQAHIQRPAPSHTPATHPRAATPTTSLWARMC